MTDYETIRFKARASRADWTICQNWREFRAYISEADQDRDNGLACLPDFSVCNSDDRILDQSNYQTMFDELSALSDKVEYLTEPRDYRRGVILVPLTESVLTEALDLLNSLRDYPVLDESDWSERELNDAEDQWLSWGQTDAYSEVSEDFSDHMDELRDTPEGNEIADDIDIAGERGFTQDGYSSDALDYRNAAEAMRIKAEEWHNLRRWQLATCNGNQVELALGI